MGIEVILIANGFFLAAMLIVLLVIMVRNGNHSPPSKKVREDIASIKQQISGPPKRRGPGRPKKR